MKKCLILIIVLSTIMMCKVKAQYMGASLNMDLALSIYQEPAQFDSPTLGIHYSVFVHPQFEVGVGGSFNAFQINNDEEQTEKHYTMPGIDFTGKLYGPSETGVNPFAVGSIGLVSYGGNSYKSLTVGVGLDIPVGCGNNMEASVKYTNFNDLKLYNIGINFDLWRW